MRWFIDCLIMIVVCMIVFILMILFYIKKFLLMYLVKDIFYSDIVKII